MENYTVSARKYRPQSFADVVGQGHVSNTLKNAIKQQHLGHSFLFTGPRGVGKTTCARILAKTINCQNITPEGEACDKCENCLSFNNHSSFNIFELDAASNNSVEDMRNLVDQVRYAPQSGKYKIYIIDEVHMLSTSAFNAFLKTLEEPPSYAIFILATTEKHKIIPTILSRCQVFDFHRITVQDITGRLQEIAAQEKITAEEEALHVIAQKADGALRDALSMFDRIVSFSGENISYKDVIENLNILDYEYYFKLTQNLLNKEVSETLLLFNEILVNGFDAHNFLNGIAEHFRNLLVCKKASTLKLLELPESAAERYKEQAQQVSMSFILTGLNLLNQFDINYKASKNQRLHVELALMKLCHIPDAVKLAEGSYTNGSSDKKKAEPITQKSSQSNSPSVESSQPSNGNKGTISGEAITKSAPVAEKPYAEAPSAKTEAVEETEKKFTNAPAPVTAEQPATKAEPAPQVAVAPSAGSLSSLEQIRNKLKQSRNEALNKEVDKPAEEDTEVAEEDKKPIEAGKALEAWKEYAGLIRNKSSLNAHMTRKLPEINFNQIIVEVENKALEEIYTKEKRDISDFLRRRLNNPTVDVQVKYVPPKEEEQRKYIVNDRDKFKRMAEINPDILKLQQNLGLDIGY